MAFITLYITHPDMETAKKIVHHLLEKKLIACGNFFPIESAYWWEGEISYDKEVVSLLKTPKKHIKQIEQEVKKMHPYKTPCIMKMEVSANEDYEHWVENETKDGLKKD